jgi:hypothetical protein
MSTDRREFLGQMAAGALLITQASGPQPDRPTVPPNAGNPSDDWDLTWVERITGKHRAVFDCPEIDGGTGFIRAVAWRTHCAQVLAVSADEISAVVVLRHRAIALAMKQDYWDRYKIGKELKVKNPFTDEDTSKNPVLLPASETPPAFGDLSLGGFLASRGIVLGCAIAFKDVIARIARGDGVDDKEAERRAKTFLVPGVILQPSGVFGAIRAQEAGCAYLRAS